ncbi:MAG: 1,4-dihydroxy-2-naphthoate polyprenyltransferase [Gemmatimonadetes bacterium]|nr:1,4-dihydroxy-2-naphthoate polyprenyltransferase [Gemmatimonadota bacterium]
MRPSAAGLWLLAARPKTLPAAAAPVIAGMGLAAHHQVFAAGPAAAALVGALLIQVATNLANDYFDFVKGSDTEARVGPTRVTQAGLLSPEAVKRGMIVVLGAALLNGAYLVAVGGWPILIVGLASLVCAVAYTGGPFPLAYHGLGDLFVFVFFGLVAVAGTYWVQALELVPGALLAGAGLGAFSTAILVVNNLRDRETDAAAGKRTLAVRWGDRATVAEYVVCVLVAGLVPVVGVVAFAWPAWVILALVGVFAAAPALRLVTGFTDRRDLNPALGGTAKGVGLYGLGMAAGFWLGS